MQALVYIVWRWKTYYLAVSRQLFNLCFDFFSRLTELKKNFQIYQAVEVSHVWKTSSIITQPVYSIQITFSFYWQNEIIFLYQGRNWLTWWPSVPWMSRCCWDQHLSRSRNFTKNFGGFQKSCFVVKCFNFKEKKATLEYCGV